jgi:hypothetical protein
VSDPSVLGPVEGNNAAVARGTGRAQHRTHTDGVGDGSTQSFPIAPPSLASDVPVAAVKLPLSQNCHGIVKEPEISSA